MALYEQIVSNNFVIAGPCVIESESILFKIAETVKKIAEKENFTYIFKASFDKANRTSLSSFRGTGIQEGLKALERVKKEFDLPVTTDIHEPAHAAMAAEVVDILQIPAFLCRQTDLLLAAGETGKIVNIKKAQFLSAAQMKYPINKVISTGNKQVMLTERGSMYGFERIVVDFTGIIDMMKFGVPVVLDATHSVQRPGSLEGKTGGNRDYVPFLAHAAAAIGVKGFFFETHPNPEEALSDGPNSVYLADFEKIIRDTHKFIDLNKSNN
ncbi:2-dehydro-3-deoxyphosphooctonate aldolase (KDO 8-P synthase) [Mucilaginibacter oryzae]|uniref:3-deoxy-8-phosphooctulonate synthase n=1 Tax=Mucilaginibacter oryzae TaxID=468058 RepID=A0A316HB74_9SPHI|nr:3-deoxy-8-phosphooctulonate synthase [Mucilaginibacter oryzae]PWK77738.1 2-dehydro-3-deoxyphosphooctonate aldolase (KDO 8-P synthase) [Mucilaginibacter oryzae]